MSTELTVESNEANPAFAVWSTAADSTAALVELLAEGTGKQSVVPVATIEEALATRAEVIVLQTTRDPEISAAILDPLKGRKVIGIGYGAAQLFGQLGLEIHAGACTHDSRDCAPTICLEKGTFIGHGLPETCGTFELASEEMHVDANFAMHLPSTSHLRAVVEGIARWAENERYSPIVRQGNCVLIGLDTPVSTWTSAYRSLFKKLAGALYARPLEPFARATWETTSPGTYQLDLGAGADTGKCTEQVFYFRFADATTFTAHLDRRAAENLMLLFMGENREHWTRKDTYDCSLGKCVVEDEPVEIACAITEADIESVGEGYWTLRVSNFDSERAAACSVDIRY